MTNKAYLIFQAIFTVVVLIAALAMSNRYITSFTFIMLLSLITIINVILRTKK